MFTIEYRVKEPVMNSVTLPEGSCMPALGLGTWHMGETPARRAEEIAAVRLALELGYRVIDTAEMYGDGGAEQIVGQALAEALRAGTLAREQVFVVSKVTPHNASRQGVAAACERSRRRLGLDHIDLYLLHWRQGERLDVVVETFTELVTAGKIRRWGVSNFDMSDLQELARLPGGSAVATDQVLYNVSRRGIEFNLLPAARQRGLNVMAYTPIEQGRILGNAALRDIAAAHRATPAQVALAWVIRQDGVVAIPRTGSPAHVRENAGALGIHLSPRDLEAIDRAFPPPARARPLEML